jgi:hypothetical protein
MEEKKPRTRDPRCWLADPHQTGALLLRATTQSNRSTDDLMIGKPPTPSAPLIWHAQATIIERIRFFFPEEAVRTWDNVVQGDRAGGPGPATTSMCREQSFSLAGGADVCGGTTSRWQRRMRPGRVYVGSGPIANLARPIEGSTRTQPTWFGLGWEKVLGPRGGRPCRRAPGKKRSWPACWPAARRATTPTQAFCCWAIERTKSPVLLLP